jgi:hypothetical protein
MSALRMESTIPPDLFRRLTIPSRISFFRYVLCK